MGVQLPQHTRICDLARILHLKLLVHLESCLGLGNSQDGPLHERVDHAGLDGFCARGGGAGVEKEEGVARLAAVRVVESVKGKAGLSRRYCLHEFGDGGWCRVVWDELDGFVRSVDLLLFRYLLANCCPVDGGKW